jgi:hypothetical protein
MSDEPTEPTEPTKVHVKITDLDFGLNRIWVLVIIGELLATFGFTNLVGSTFSQYVGIFCLVGGLFLALDAAIAAIIKGANG